jgi:hypothetical protein
MGTGTNEAALKTMAPYKVMVDDNFHYMDEDERWELGRFATAGEALAACRKLVDESLIEEYRDGATADQLFDRYTSFGDEPFVVALDGAPKVDFSARTYAEQRARELAVAGPEAETRRQAILAGKKSGDGH